MLARLSRGWFLLLCLVSCSGVAAVTSMSGGLLITGTLAEYRGVLRPDAGLEIQGHNALLSLLNQTFPPDQDAESALVLGHLDAQGVPRKAASLSAKWADGEGETAVLRLNAVFDIDHDDVGIRLWAGQGIRLFGGGCDHVRCAPGPQTFQVDGQVRFPQLPRWRQGAQTTLSMWALCIDAEGNLFRSATGSC